MDENTEELDAGIFKEIEQLLSDSSETLATLNTNIEQDVQVSQEKPEWSLGNAPIKSPEDPNFELFKQAFEEGNETALIDTEDTDTNTQTAISMLLRSPDFQSFIGQYALSNDVVDNIQVLHQAINNQKNTESTSEFIGEVDGNVFTGGEAYFLQEFLNRLENSNELDTFFSQLREQINTEVLQKIETEENQQITQNSLDIEPFDSSAEPVVEEELTSDPLQLVGTLLNEREGQIIEDVTTSEKINELKRMLQTPEYTQIRTEQLGYNPEEGHPDIEIQQYLDAMQDWAKQSYSERGLKPTKPENYEQRLNLKTNELNISPTSELKSIETTTSNIPEENINTQESFTQNVQNVTKPTQEENFNLNDNIIIQDDKNEDNTLTELFTLLQKQTNVKDSELLDVINNLQPQQEKFSYEVDSNLPTNEMFSQVEQTNNEDSTKILENTQKTNIILEALTQMLVAFIQAGGGSAQSPTIPVAMGPSGDTDPGITDAMATAGQGLITDIRSKFIYA